MRHLHVRRLFFLSQPFSPSAPTLRHVKVSMVGRPPGGLCDNRNYKRSAGSLVGYKLLSLDSE